MEHLPRGFVSPHRDRACAATAVNWSSEFFRDQHLRQNVKSSPGRLNSAEWTRNIQWARCFAWVYACGPALCWATPSRHARGIPRWPASPRKGPLFWLPAHFFYL